MIVELIDDMNEMDKKNWSDLPKDALPRASYRIGRGQPSTQEKCEI